jgi:hypothetical protein
MKFRKAITFFASVAVFIASTSASVAATSSLLRGGEDIHHQNDRILTSEQPGTFLIVRILVPLVETIFFLFHSSIVNLLSLCSLFFAH